jgi:hypothetical protein
MIVVWTFRYTTIAIWIFGYHTYTLLKYWANTQERGTVYELRPKPFGSNTL